MQKEIKDSAEKLKKEKDKFEALFQYASLGILVVDEKGTINIVNNFLLSMLGYDENELAGKKIEFVIPSRYHHNHSKYRENYHAHPEPRPMGVGKDLYALCKDGTELAVEVSLSNYKAKEGEFTIAFVSNITRRKEIENSVIYQKEQLAEINTKIEELNNDLEKKVEQRTRELQVTLGKLEESRQELMVALSKEKELSDLKSRFVSMASHEFRTPLSTILSSASLVAKYTAADEQINRQKHIDRIKNSVNNLTGILNEFLSLGKIEDGKIIANYSEFNIKENIEQVCNEMTAHVKPGQEIVYDHRGPESIYLDPAMLRNIVINLLSNAIKFSSKNGRIIVVSEVTEQAINLSIKDNGIGISTEDQGHLFERFFRAANATNIQGTGLGLHIVGKYVELLNGQVACKSELEKGTIFNISFNRK